MASTEPPTVHNARSDIMVGVRTGNAERESQGRRALAEAKIADSIQKALAVSPPLTADQVRRLTVLIRAGGKPIRAGAQAASDQGRSK